MSQEEEPGSRRVIEVTITPKGEGKIVFYSNNRPLSQPPAVPDNMSGSEALKRAKEFQEGSVGYDLEVNDLSRTN